LEAMACGTPVCLSSIPVFHEIYGRTDVCYGDPLDTEAFSSSLCRSLTDVDYRIRLRKRGLQLAQKYTWDSAFDGYRAVFNELLT
jgi:glycosyltransferase involved in cell wall biosynthesis